MFKRMFVILLFLTSPLFAQNLTDFEKKVTEFTLDNGLKFIVIERHEAPVVSFFTYANVGAVNENAGQTGIAHMFEHMAFKGTKNIGSKDINKELDAMKKEDEAFLRLREERDKGKQADPKKLDELQKEFAAATQTAEQWSNASEVDEVMERAGAVGINANTTYDSTRYYYSLPSNKIELWFSLESDRFLDPVLRDFYTERGVVMEERRGSVDSNPTGRLVEEFTAASFKAHPYKEPVIGFMSDLQDLSRPDAEAFFHTYYGANNLTIAIAGDVNPQEVRKMAQTYFGRLPKIPEPPAVHTVEPEQPGEKRITVEDRAQPFLVFGYHKGDINDPDENTFDVLSDILGRGRASRLYRKLVKEQKIAVNASGFPGFPEDKYPNLFVFFAVPTPGHTTEECEKSILEEIDRLKTEPVSADELAKAKTRSRADVIRSLNSNSGLAQQLVEYQVLTGDWRNLFRDLDKINAVTAADIQRVAQKYFVTKHRTVAVIHTIRASS